VLTLPDGIPASRPGPARVLIVAGEASGDAHAARLIGALREQVPQLEVFGVGGEALAHEGVELLFPAAELAVVGLSEVAVKLPAVIRALALLNRAMRERRPGLVILVDFPDFNFWVARLARRQGLRVMYYISPQVWAWRTYRVRTLARLTDRLVVIFPFEKDFYARRGVAVDFVGHPFRETLPPAPPRGQWLAARGLDPAALTLALLPGSRSSEVERFLVSMLAAAKLLHEALPGCQFVLPVASTIPPACVASLVEGFPGRLAVIDGQAYEALSAAHLALVASGTVTLEAALASTPTVIVYRVSPLSALVARLLIRVDHVGMANLLAGERLFPELLQEQFTPEALAREVLAFIQEPSRLSALGQGLRRIITRLGGPGASQRAARVALELMTQAPA
jgi:lipid-A-disaccharide synthase